MIQKFSYNSRAMEAETIQKNAACPKSRMSRGNIFSIIQPSGELFKRFELKPQRVISLATIIIILAMTLASESSCTSSNKESNNEPYTFIDSVTVINSIDSIVVNKQLNKLTVYSSNKSYSTYCSLGVVPGRKQYEGDKKTPEGVYTITYKNPNSVAYKSLTISYPNQEDRREGRTGNSITIHGTGNLVSLNYHHSSNWTWGCVAVTNEEIDVIYKKTKTGTKVVIRKD
jgi:murein L,D-transpeptidase YafK